MYRERGITVKEALQLDILQGAKVIAGAKGLNRVISSVNVMEVPDIFDWVKKGDFILTTAYSIRNDPEAQIRLIPEFHKRELAGLGIKTKRYIESVPDKMIEIANKLNFPIIEIPLDVSFTDIINPILTHIVNKQTALLLKIDDVHKKLMNVLLEGGGLQEVARTLYKLVGNPLVIEDIIFGNRYAAGDRDFLERVYLKTTEERIGSEKWYGEYEDKVDIKDVVDTLEGREIKRKIITIVTGKRVYGYIFIWEVNKPLTPMDLRIIENTFAITALEITKQSSVFEVERKYKNEFLEDLLSGDSHMCKIALERAAFFGLDLEKDYVAMVLKIEDIEKYFQKTINNTHYLQYYKNSIIRIIEKVLKEKGSKSLIGSKSDQITLLISVDKRMDFLKVKHQTLELAKKIYYRVNEEARDSKIKIAIGRYFPGHENIWKSYNTALKALTLGNYLDEKIIHFEDLGVYRLLCNENIRPELETFFQENLQPLLEYDRSKNGELIKTLEMYFNTNGNLKKVSELMYTHYNTILYRIQKIQELTKANLNNPHDRLNLQVALSIMHIIKNN